MFEFVEDVGIASVEEGDDGDLGARETQAREEGVEGGGDAGL